MQVRHKATNKPVQTRTRWCKMQNSDSQHLQRCRELIAAKLSWPAASEWRNYEFTELSERIFESTGISLSTTTLKRVFGKVQYDSLPSSITLNVLAKFVGFDSWMHFRSQQEVTMPSQVNKKARLVNERSVFVVVALVVLVVVCGFIFLPRKKAIASVDASGVVFTSRPIAQGLPNSVVFNVDLKDIKAENLLIQQYWDSTKTVKLKPGQTEATGIYYRPGYFRAKLIADGQVLKEHDLFIKADQWMATIDHEPVPTYIDKKELVLNKHLDVSDEVKEGIKKLEQPVPLTYHLVRPFGGLQSDNFTFETAIANSWNKGPAVCQTSKIFILCTNGAFIIPFAIPGCVSDINLKLGDKYFEGKSNDLSVFGVDLTKPLHVKVEVVNRKVRIMANGKLLREDSYATNAGEVVGLRFSFLGTGAVDYVRLLNENGVAVYDEHFK